MATNLRNFDSTGGFSVGKSEIVDNFKNFTNVNTLEIKNYNFSNATTTKYILSGTNTGVLSLGPLGGTSEQIFLPNNTINFITGTVVASNSNGGGFYVVKIESAVTVGGAGNVQEIGELDTIIRDTIPNGQEWSINGYDSGSANRYSYTTSRTGTTETVKWVASTEVVSITWS